MSCLRPLRDDAENLEAAFVASGDYVIVVTVQGLKGLKFAVVCYFQGRIFDHTNLLNHMAPSIKLMMQM